MGWSRTVFYSVRLNFKKKFVIQHNAVDLRFILLGNVCSHVGLYLANDWKVWLEYKRWWLVQNWSFWLKPNLVWNVHGRIILCLVNFCKWCNGKHHPINWAWHYSQLLYKFFWNCILLNVFCRFRDGVYDARSKKIWK